MAYAQGWWSGNRVAVKFAQAVQTLMVSNAGAQRLQHIS